jgi:hypothetical protein
LAAASATNEVDPIMLLLRKTAANVSGDLCPSANAKFSAADELDSATLIP